MKIRYSVRARNDLERIGAYFENRAPTTARSVQDAIRQRIELLSDLPLLAPLTDEDGVRELTMLRYPYKVYYTVAGDEVRILHIRDARRRPKTDEPGA